MTAASPRLSYAFADRTCMMKFLSLGFVLAAITFGSGCISYSSTTRKAPAPAPASLGAILVASATKPGAAAKRRDCSGTPLNARRARTCHAAPSRWSYFIR